MPQRSDPTRVEIQIVVVPPAGQSFAYGHDEEGSCVRVDSDRATMLDLFHRLRAEGREKQPGKVYLSKADCARITSIARASCPTHTLPTIAESSAVAWAPY